MDDTIFFDAISEVFDADLAGTSDGPQSSATLESALDQGDVVLGSDGSDPNSTGNRAVSDDAALGVSHRILTRSSTREKWGVSLQWTVPATDGVCGFVAALVVRDVLRGGPADRCGLARGDRILTVDGVCLAAFSDGTERRPDGATSRPSRAATLRL
jgi:hypothetical protein